MEVNYRYNSKHEENIKECINYILEKQYGDTIPYQQIAKILRINISEENELKKMKYLMYKIKNVLIDYGYILKSIGGIGWYILKPQQISSYTYRSYILKPQRLYEKAERILEHVDRAKFSQLQSQEHYEVKELNEDISDISWNVIQESDYFKNKEKYKEV